MNIARKRIDENFQPENQGSKRYLDFPPVLTPTVRTPQWTHCLGKHHVDPCSMPVSWRRWQQQELRRDLCIKENIVNLLVRILHSWGGAVSYCNVVTKMGQNGLARHKCLSFSALAAEFPELLPIASRLSTANEGLVDAKENLPHPPANSDLKPLRVSWARSDQDQEDHSIAAGAVRTHQSFQHLLLQHWSNIAEGSWKA